MSQSNVIQLPEEQKQANDDAASSLMQEWVRMEDIERWVSDYLSTNGYEITANALFKRVDQLEQHSSVLKKMIIRYDIDYKALNRKLVDVRVDAAKKHVMEFALDTKIEDAWRAWLSKKLETIKSSGAQSNLDELRKFVAACTGSCSELDLHVLAHWLWQVKRKMNGLSVKNHVMIVMTGKQGSGKSTAITTLVAPIKEYRLDLNLESLADDRHYHGLSRNFVIVCDEMQGCNKTDIETLKHIVTADTLSARKLYTNAIDSISQNVSFLGTSNKSLDVLIKDETGMRRFFELKCSDMMDWNAISSIDPLLIWQEIDENRPFGYLDAVKGDLQKRQEEYRYRDSAESYLVETTAFDGSMTKLRSVEDLFRDYVEWCKECQHKPFDKAYFSKRVRALGFQEKRSSRSRGYYVGNQFTYWRDKKIAFMDLADESESKK